MKANRPTTSKQKPKSFNRPSSAAKYSPALQQLSILKGPIANKNSQPLPLPITNRKIDPPADKNTQETIEFPLNYRIAHPKKSNYIVSLEFWKENSQNNKSLVNWSRPQSSINPQTSLFRGSSLPKGEIHEEAQLFRIGAKTITQNIGLEKFPNDNEKPFVFLSSLGGRKTSFLQIATAPTEENPKPVAQQEDFEDITKAIQQFSKLDIDKSFRTQLKRQASAKQRPLTGISNSNRLNVMQISGQFRVGSQALQQERVPSGLPLVKGGELNVFGKESTLGTGRSQGKRPMTAKIETSYKAKQKDFSSKNRVFSGEIQRRTLRSAKKEMLQNQIIEKNQEFFDEEIDIKEDFEENDDFYEKAEALQGFLFKTRPQSNLLRSRPISGRSAAPEQFFNTFTKYAKFNDIELPYEELFDRNERTIAATYAKFGDLGYYSPVQRIGAYMQYSAKLKREHLIEIINLQKTSNFLIFIKLIFLLFALVYA